MEIDLKVVCVLAFLESKIFAMEKVFAKYDERNEKSD